MVLINIYVYVLLGKYHLTSKCKCQKDVKIYSNSQYRASRYNFHNLYSVYLYLNNR